MVEAPRGVVAYSSAFSRPASPDPNLLRKRVSNIYRPYPPGAAVVFNANKKRKATFPGRVLA